MADSQSTNSAPSAQPTLFEQEVWKPIPGYEGFYEVSSKGRVRSLDRQVRVGHGATRTAPGIVLSPGKAGRGYPFVNLRRYGKKQMHYVHTLVALVFHGEPPGPIGPATGNWQVNHKNGDITDNRPSNVEWVTREQNTKHAHESGLYKRGSDVHNAQLTASNVRQIRHKYAKEDVTYRQLAEEFGVSESNIGSVIRRQIWAHVA